MNPENEVKNGSSPDPSPPQISTSAGCEPESVISAPDPPLPPPSTSAGCEPDPVISVTDPSVPPQPNTSAGYEENSPPSGPVPDETPCESIEANADQCNVTSDEPRPRDSMVTAQLNDKDSGLLSDFQTIEQTCLPLMNSQPETYLTENYQGYRRPSLTASYQIQ